MSPIPLGGALSGGMNEPASPDPTSAPIIQAPQAPNTVAQTLAKRKKGFGPGIRNPAALASAIQRSRRARQQGDKWGN